jgi:rhodanese-related sulfurtransferase
LRPWSKNCATLDLLRMDDRKHSISPDTLYARLGSDAAPIIVDVRRDVDFAGAETLLADAFHRSRDAVEQWQTDLPSGRQIVTYCIHGREVSQGVAAALRLMGVDANFLEGGIADWTEQGLPTRRNIGASPGKWVTREHPKIDRIACPWLIRRFIDPNAEFIYVAKEQVLAVAQQTGGIPYDIEGVEFTHEGERCSFDTILRIYEINDPALDHLATIVRGADTSRHGLSPQCGGLFAISLGLSANFPDDHEMLKHGMVIYDALYTWCRSLQAETHNWPARAVIAWLRSLPASMDDKYHQCDGAVSRRQVWNDTAQHFTSLGSVVYAKDDVLTPMRRRTRAQNGRLYVPYFEDRNICCRHLVIF